MFSKAKLDKWLRVSVRRQKLDAHLELLSPRMKGRVLEIGCGRSGRRGDFRPPISSASRWVYADISHKNKPHIQANIGSLPILNDHFDLVVCLEVLEYVRDPKDALLEIKRILNDRGALILATPFLHRMDTPSDYWRFTEAGLRQMLAEAGFLVQQFYSQGAALSVVANILKFATSTQQSHRMRMLAGFFVRPLCSFLQWWDERLVKSNQLLGSFSTGFLLLAEVSGGEK